MRTRGARPGPADAPRPVDDEGLANAVALFLLLAEVDARRKKQHGGELPEVRA